MNTPRYAAAHRESATPMNLDVTTRSTSGLQPDWAREDTDGMPVAPATKTPDRRDSGKSVPAVVTGRISRHCH
jgi:hypothetical protein